MQTLITCGTPWCALQPLQALLQTAGLGQARQAKAGSVVGIDQWHDRLCGGQADVASPMQPGKPWELAAGEIFLANWDQPTWGWADSRSTWLLEFWRDFDSSTRFVLLYTPAYDVLCRAMADTGAAAVDSQALLDTWCAYQTEMLRFYHRNRARSVLLHAHLAHQPGTQLVQTINQALGTALSGPESVPSDPQPVDPLLHLLVQSVLQNHPEVRSLEDEINATLPECDAIQSVPVADTASAIACLRALYAKEAEHRHALQAQNATNVELRQENDHCVSERQQLHEIVRRQQLAIENAQRAEQQLSHAQKELTQENELLLLQLHQVQEELEQVLLGNQRLENQIAATLQDHKALVNQNAQRAAQEKDQSLLERKQLQEELQRRQLAFENAQRAEQQLRHAQKELTQGNELLLLQLQQVHEELERYFLQHQQAMQDKQALEAQFNKLLARYPDHAEWDRVELLSSIVPLRSQIFGLKVGSLSPRQVDIAVEVVDRTPVLVLTPPEKAADQPLHYWPTGSTPDASTPLEPLLLNPLAPPGTDSAALLRSLATGDLKLLRAACTAMAQELPAGLPARDAWVEVIGTLRQQLAQLLPAWRFDTVELKRQQVNPGYEHLWFQLGNASFGGRHWPTFEFRLSAADIKKGKFSHLPKLEFPLPSQGAKQFENLFDEAQDKADPRFELRFDTKNKAMDIGQWKALSAADQAQALSICEQLPTLLRRLQAQGVQIARPWENWQTLASGLQQALAHCLGLKSLVTGVA